MQGDVTVPIERERPAPAGGSVAVALSAGAAIAAALALRLPFRGLPLTADEGGYAEIARLWAQGHVLYGDLWVDRPQGLILAFRGLLAAGLGSVGDLRLAAALVAAAAALLLGGLVAALHGRRAGLAAALLLAGAGSSPFIESFTLSGELLASFFSLLSLLAFARLVRGGGARWALLAGLLCGCALMTKQSGFDAGLAAAAWIVLDARRRSRRGRALVGLAAGAAAPVTAGVLAASSSSAWWDQVVAYRNQGDSLLTGSLLHRLGLLAGSLPVALLALGAVALLAAWGWRRAHLLLRMWLVAAALGLLGGGNFHAHYYIQLAPPLCALAALGACDLLAQRRRLGLLALALTALLALVPPLALGERSRSAQARWVWPHDPHLVTDGRVAAAVDTVAPPGQRIAVVWGAADVYYLADRAPAVRYLWARPAQSVPGAAAHDLGVLAREPLVVVVLDWARSSYPRLRAILRCGYRRVETLGDTSLYVPRPQAWQDGSALRCG